MVTLTAKLEGEFVSHPEQILFNAGTWWNLLKYILVYWLYNNYLYLKPNSGYMEITVSQGKGFSLKMGKDVVVDAKYTFHICSHLLGFRCKYFSYNRYKF